MSTSITRVIPILRIFDLAKAREFYVDYMQVSRDGLVLHLTEHHGDACPGARACIESTGVAALHAELTAKQVRFNRPGLEQTPWGTQEVEVTDPFGNRLTFAERIAR